MLSLLRVAGVVTLLLVALAAVVWFGQRHLLYFPTRTDHDVALRIARARGLEPWTDRSGAFLGWRAPHPGGAPVARAIVLHGNAGTALDRTYLRDVLQGPGLPPIEVLLLEYPGYGPRGGSPSEASIVQATIDAIDALGTDVPILLVGESLGSAAAALAAAARPRVAGLLLVTPVASVTSLASRHYPIVPSFLVRDGLPGRPCAPPVRRPGRVPPRRPGRGGAARPGACPLRRRIRGRSSSGSSRTRRTTRSATAPGIRSGVRSRRSSARGSRRDALVPETLQFLSAAAIGPYAGTMLTLALRSGNARPLSPFLGPITWLAALLSLAAAVAAQATVHPGRWSALGAAALMVLDAVAHFGSLRWGARGGPRVRAVAGLAAFVAALLALARAG